MLFICVHLKPKPSFRDRVREYVVDLKRYFLEYSKIYVLSFKPLPLTYKLRLPYYLLLPWVVIVSSILLPTPLYLLTITLYILLSLTTNLILAKLKVFPINVPTTSKFILNKAVAKLPVVRLIISHLTH